MDEEPHKHTTNNNKKDTEGQQTSACACTHETYLSYNEWIILLYLLQHTQRFMYGVLDKDRVGSCFSEPCCDNSHQVFQWAH